MRRNFDVCVCVLLYGFDLIAYPELYSGYTCFVVVVVVLDV